MLVRGRGDILSRVLQVILQTTYSVLYNKSMKLIAGSSNASLAQSISTLLNTPLVTTEISTFQNGEKRVWIQEHIAGEDVILIQSFSQPVDENIIEFLLLADAVQRLGAKNIHVIIPWMGYSLQDKVFLPGEPIAAKVIANLVSNAGIDRVYLLDLHNSSTPGFFSVPSVHLSAMELFAADVRQRFPDADIVVASPDFGGLKRARQFATMLGTELINVDKHRDLNTGEVTAVGLHGSVQGKTVLLFDDVIVSGGTVTEVADLLKREGAAEAHFFATHGPLVPAALEKLEESSMDSITVTNSIAHKNLPQKLKVIDVGILFVHAIEEWL